jgi:hypothetical protein
MTTPTPLAIPFWQSRVVQMLTVAIITQLLAALHFSNIAPEQIQAIAQWLLEGGAGVATLWAMHARVNMHNPQIVSTQAAATAINSASLQPPAPSAGSAS